MKKEKKKEKKKKKELHFTYKLRVVLVSVTPIHQIMRYHPFVPRRRSGGWKISGTYSRSEDCFIYSFLFLFCYLLLRC